MSPHMPAKWIFVLLASACSVLGQTPPPGGARPLDVIVLDQSRLPVPGAEVEIALGNQSIATVFSDQSGSTVFPLPKPGRYTIRVSKAGFETAAVPDFASGRGRSRFAGSDAHGRGNQRDRRSARRGIRR